MIELLNCDCMDYMKDVPDKFFELAIVDPPYGSEADATKTFTSNSVNKAAARTIYKQFKNEIPDRSYFEELKRVSKNQIVWGGNFFGLEGGYICWNKNGTAFGEAELAFCSMQKSVSIFECTWNGMIQHDMKNKENRIHPTQKPVKLYKWLLKNYAKEGDKIFDSHGGSMSIAIACHDMKFDLTLCEIDKDYFDAGIKRYENHKKQLNLF
jgi:site-specific DNA-methyltransferase (adenine-specific)